MSSRPRRRDLLTVCLILIGFLAVASTEADERKIEDADDSASALDIEQLKQGHYQKYVLYRVDSRERWQPSDLDGGSMIFSFDTDDDPAIERRVILEYRVGGGSQLRSPVVDEAGEKIGTAVHRRPTQRSVEIWIKRWQLGQPKRYRMFVEVTTVAPGVCEAGCTDRAPEGGRISHRLRPLCVYREATIRGTPGNDRIKGTKRFDVIDAGGGDDEIVDVTDTDIVCGRAGDDVIKGGSGYLTLRGGPGNDRIEATGPRPSGCDDNGSCAYPEAHLVGGSGRDVLIGGRYHEALYGQRGSDSLSGRGFGDRLNGGEGEDGLRGGSGEDYCVRGERRDSCEH